MDVIDTNTLAALRSLQEEGDDDLLAELIDLFLQDAPERVGGDQGGASADATGSRSASARTASRAAAPASARSTWPGSAPASRRWAGGWRRGPRRRRRLRRAGTPVRRWVARARMHARARRRSPAEAVPLSPRARAARVRSHRRPVPGGLGYSAGRDGDESGHRERRRSGPAGRARHRAGGGRTADRPVRRAAGADAAGAPVYPRRRRAPSDRRTQEATARRAHATAAAAGRVSKFTPASGAASRMFQSLLAVRGAGLRDRDRSGDAGGRRRRRGGRRADVPRQPAALRLRRRAARGGGARRAAARRRGSRRATSARCSTRC